MKKLLAKIGWLLAVIITVAILTLLFTGIIQTTMSALWGNLSEATLFGVSGTLGSGLTALAIWLIIRYNKHFGFYRCAKPKGKIWIVAFIVFTITTCRIVLPGIWAYVSYVIDVPATPIGNNTDEPLWQMIVFGVLLAPMLEELLFRKDLFSLLLKRFSMSWTIGLTALIFAAIHGYSLEGFVSCPLAGTLFAILMERTGSFWLCAIAHILCNLESLAYNLLEKDGTSLIVDLGGHTTYNIFIFSIGCIVMGCTLIYLIPKKSKTAQ